jgi:hypothetical protein
VFSAYGESQSFFLLLSFLWILLTEFYCCLAIAGIVCQGKVGRGCKELEGTKPSPRISPRTSMSISSKQENPTDTHAKTNHHARSDFEPLDDHRVYPIHSCHIGLEPGSASLASHSYFSCSLHSAPVNQQSQIVRSESIHSVWCCPGGRTTTLSRRFTTRRDTKACCVTSAQPEFEPQLSSICRLFRPLFLSFIAFQSHWEPKSVAPPPKLANSTTRLRSC